MTSSLEERYLDFVASAPPSRDGYLFDTPRCRFWPEPSDELVLVPGARARQTAGGVVVQVGAAELPLVGLPLALVERALSLFPCRYARLALELGPSVDAFIEQTFSRCVLAPTAVAELELAQPACEIVRFPGSPYEVVRAYWRNVSAVRRELSSLAAPPPSGGELRELLSALHRLLLLGSETEGRRSYYLPASALARKRTKPGELYEQPSTFERRGHVVLLTGGARVSAPLLGGALYWQLLAESVEDLGALEPERQLLVDSDDLGMVVTGRAQDEDQDRPWFLPPRPLTERHWLALCAAWQSASERARAGDAAGLLSALATFHYRFVRAHPLPSGNQSIAMSVVNHLLSPVLGIGVPHLLLDQLALRFELQAYIRLFERAARAWCRPWPSATERVRSLVRMRAELNELVTLVGEKASSLEARALLADQVDKAALALLPVVDDVRLGIG